MASNDREHFETRDRVPEFVSVKEEIEGGYSYDQVFVTGSNIESNLVHLTKEQSYDETDLSGDQFQQHILGADGSKNNIECSESDKRLKRKREIHKVFTDFRECWKDQKIQVGGTSDQVSCDMNIDSSETGTRAVTSARKYSNYIQTTQDSLECKTNSFSLVGCSNNCKAYQETSETVCIQDFSMGAKIKSEDGILEASTSELAYGSRSNHGITESNESINIHHNSSNDLKISSQFKLDTEIGLLFECKECGAKFKQTRSLERHMRIHRGQKHFYCSICGSKFNEMSNLKQHMKIHTDKTPFDCNICGSRFNETMNLKLHMRIHTGEKHFECNTCGFTFSQPRNLKLHMRIHTGEQPYVCNTCGAKFTQSDDLKLHMGIHTGDDECECKVCGAKFSHHSSLKHHIQIHARVNARNVELSL